MRRTAAVLAPERLQLLRHLFQALCAIGGGRGREVMKKQWQLVSEGVRKGDRARRRAGGTGVSKSWFEGNGWAWRDVSRHARGCDRSVASTHAPCTLGGRGKGNEASRRDDREHEKKEKKKIAWIAGPSTRAYHLQLEALRRRFRDVPELEQGFEQVLFFFRRLFHRGGALHGRRSGSLFPSTLLLLFLLRGRRLLGLARGRQRRGALFVRLEG